MTFHLITIFPKIFDSYLNESILKRAQKNKKVEIKVYNLRDFTDDKHKTTDDTPYGGGPGMVMKVEPIYECVKFIKSKVPAKGWSASGGKSESTSLPTSLKLRRSGKLKVILTSAKGEEYTQWKAESLKGYDHVVIICGRYEGVDERVTEHIADEEISIGKYVLTGGELPAMVIVDSVTRLISGVLGNEESLSSESHLGMMNDECKMMNDYPVYTKPEEFNGWKVPEVLQNGNHAEIEKWRGEKMMNDK